MTDIINSMVKAWRLIIVFDREIVEIIALTLLVTVISAGVAAIIGAPLGALIGSREFAGRRFIVRVINTLMGLPPVVAGLVVYLFLSRKGPLGSLGLLFTPPAMVLAQIIIVTPIITGLTIAAVKSKSKLVTETCMGLGMKGPQIFTVLLRECRYPIYAALLAGYGRAISEVGAVMLVGGNIQHQTRVMTTAIVLETGKGNYEQALALGMFLLLASFVMNWILQRFQEGQ